ncbi:MAG: alginate lyase family protein [Gammaproteobacteria bacterium]|nr:MAG: alginate lyase family protein [Gammaproteobacteria bacterium]
MEWLLWSMRKIASQDLTYVPRRVHAVLHRWWINHCFPTAGMANHARISLPSDAHQSDCRGYYLARTSPRWHWEKGSITAIVRSIPKARQVGTLRVAQDILARRFSFRGREPIELPSGEWWPDATSLGWKWDLNRHHWFATLGFAYWYSLEDKRFLRCFLEESGDWMDQHIGKLGQLALDTPFEIASRINAWIWAHYLFLPASHWPRSHYEQFIRGLGLLAEYLSHAIELHCSGNHILLEAKALALVSEAFPEFRGAARWRHQAWTILNRELRGQVCGDGVHVERSTMYHKIIAGELSDLLLFLSRNGDKRASSLQLVVEKMTTFLLWIDQGSGQLPQFGDSHIEDTYQRFQSLAACPTLAAEFGCRLETETTDHTHWLLAGSPASSQVEQPFTQTACGYAFMEGGYFVARSGWSQDCDVLVWDCGPTGYERNRKHAHLDTLSFTLSVSGIPILIDPGVHESGVGLEPLRRTQAHNTICIDAKDQGILAQRGEIWSSPEAQLLLWATSPSCTVMVGRHNGYERLRDPVSVTRTIIAMHGLYWLVLDSLEGLGQHSIEQRLHLAPDSDVVIDASNARAQVTTRGTTLNLAYLVTTGTSQLEHSAAISLQLESSYAELYCGHPESSTVIVAKPPPQLPLTISTLIYKPDRNLAIVPQHFDEIGNCLVITGDDFRHQVHVDFRTGTAALPLIPGWKEATPVAIFRHFRETGRDDVLLPSSLSIPSDSVQPPAVPYRRHSHSEIVCMEVPASCIPD